MTNTTTQTITAADVREGDTITAYRIPGSFRGFNGTGEPVTITSVSRATFDVFAPDHRRVPVEHAVLVHETGRFNLPLASDVQVAR